MVSDEVWSGLDPNAGRLSRRAERWFTLAPALSLALIIAAMLGWGSGIVRPRVEWSNTGHSWSYGHELVQHSVSVVNRGWFPVTVTGAGRHGPGLTLVEVRGDFPTTLHRGNSMELMLVYRVTNCSSVPAEPWPVPVRVERLWGTHTSYVPAPTIPSPSAPAHRTYSGPDPYGVEWQRALADGYCAVR
ncbi:MAG TPA: hypothetical protein VFC00_18665 [Micromonosporaceae bacterium]|nr:hypothetical protein [Micromonosporaceae bacterium]